MKKYLNRILNNQKGMSLIELIVAIVVGAILVSATTPIVDVILGTYITATGVQEKQQEARIAFNRMINELRMIPSQTDITTLTSNSIAFTDFDGNTIQYSLSGNDLQRNGFTCAQSITSFSIQSMDVNNTVVTPSALNANVWSLQVSLTVQAQIGSDMRTYTFQSQVNPRPF